MRFYQRLIPGSPDISGLSSGGRPLWSGPAAAGDAGAEGERRGSAGGCFRRIAARTGAIRRETDCPNSRGTGTAFPGGADRVPGGGPRIGGPSVFRGPDGFLARKGGGGRPVFVKECQRTGTAETETGNLSGKCTKALRRRRSDGAFFRRKCTFRQNTHFCPSRQGAFPGKTGEKSAYSPKMNETDRLLHFDEKSTEAPKTFPC